MDQMIRTQKPRKQPTEKPVAPESLKTIPTAQVRKKKDKLKLLLAALLLLAIGTSGYLYYRYNQATSDPQGQLEQKNSTETKEVLDSLGRILLLPTDKQPTVAKVEDVDKLKKSNETFYKDVTKGDYLVLYTDRAIIYRKTENKIINIAPIVDTSRATTKTEPKQ